MSWFRRETIDPGLETKLLAIARSTATSRAWPWLDPVEIEVVVAIPEKREWVVRTNAHSRGVNVRIRIREADFEVLEAVFLPR